MKLHLCEGTGEMNEFDSVFLAQNEVLRVTKDGDFIWNGNADALIANGDFSNAPAMKHILIALRKLEKQDERRT